MIVVVFFIPETGVILQCTAGRRVSIEADGRPFVEVAKFRPDYDVTHHVVDGAVVPKP